MNNTDKCNDSLCYFSNILASVNRNFRIYLTPLLLILGLFGHLSSIKIFIQRKDLIGTCRIYYLSVSIGEIGYFIFVGIPRWTGFGLFYITNGLTSFWPEKISVVTCRIFSYGWYISIFFLTWAIIIYTLESVVVISFPFFLGKELRSSNAKKICFGLLIFDVIAMSPVFYSEIFLLIGGDLPIPQKLCFANVARAKIIPQIWYHIMVTTLLNLLPSILLIILSFLLFIQVKKIARQRLDLMPLTKLRQTEVKSTLDLLFFSMLIIAFFFPTYSWSLNSYFKDGMMEGNSV